MLLIAKAPKQNVTLQNFIKSLRKNLGGKILRSFVQSLAGKSAQNVDLAHQALHGLARVRLLSKFRKIYVKWSTLKMLYIKKQYWPKTFGIFCTKSFIFFLCLSHGNHCADTFSRLTDSGRILKKVSWSCREICQKNEKVFTRTHPKKKHKSFGKKSTDLILVISSNKQL